MLANGDIFHGDHHPVEVYAARESRNLADPSRVFIQPNNIRYWYATNTAEFNLGGFKIAEGETYTICCSAEASGLYFYNVTAPWTSENLATKYKATFLTFTADKAYDHVSINAYWSNGVPEGAELWLVKGSTPLPYEPYGIVTDAIFTPTNLKKSGTEVTFEKSYNHTAEVEVAGKSEQVQLTGKNLLNMSSESASLTIESSYYNDIASGTTPYPYKILNRYELEAGVGYTFCAKIVSDVEPFNISVGAGTGYFQRDVASATNRTNGWNYFYFVPTEAQLSSGNIVALRPCRYATKMDRVNYTVEKMMLIKGNVSPSEADYEPYCGGIPSPNPDYPQPIESIDSVELVSRGRNLVDPSKLFRAMYSGGVPMRASWLSNDFKGFPYTPGLVTYGLGYFIHAKAGETYTASYTGESDKRSLAWATYADESKVNSNSNRFEFVDAGRAIKKRTVTVEQDCVILFLWSNDYFAGEIVPFDDVSELVIERGEIAHPYEPYHLTTRTIDMQGNQLRSLPDGTHDELRVNRDGSVELAKRVGNGTITSANAWTLQQRTSPNVQRFYTQGVIPTSEAKTERRKTMSNYGAWDSNEKENSQYLYSNQFFIHTTKANSVEEFKALVAKQPIEFQYAMLNPQTITLPSIEPLPTYWPTTVVYDENGNDISAYVTVVEDSNTAALLSVMAQL